MNPFQIIVTIAEKEIQNLHEYSLEKVDILEIRLDLCSIEFIQSQLPEILKGIQKKFLFTYRLPEDSGVSQHTKLEKKDVRNLLTIFSNQKNYLDIEIGNRNSIFSNFLEGFELILSHHDFQKTLSLGEMQELIKNSFYSENSNFIYKFAVQGKSILEASNFMNSINELAKNYRMIGIVMGNWGKYSRVFGDLFGSEMTYCTLGEPKAPGQLQVDTLFDIRKKMNPVQEKKKQRYIEIE